MALSLTIEKLVYGGDGLSRLDGEVVFTPFVLPGEVVTAERTGYRQNTERAKLTGIETPSEDRVNPVCRYFMQCGGCQYQHAGYDAQVRIKRDILAETLRRVGKIDFAGERIGTVAGEPFGYRNRAQFHFDKGKLGYMAAGSRTLVPIERCPIVSPKLNEVIAKLNRMTKDLRWPRFLTSLEVFTDETQVQWNVLETGKPVAKHFFEWLAQEVPGTVAGELNYRVGEDIFTVSGTSFFQVNRHLISKLVNKALDGASGETAWDLFAGVGLFSLELARRFPKVVAVESGRTAAEDLKVNARRAKLKVGVERLSAEAYLLGADETPDFVLADPPRAGLGKGATQRLLELKPKAITLVACDPATLARDLAALSVSYSIDAVTMVDLFPQTYHIETIAKLKLRG